jgi:hypothetical protein
MWNRDSIISVGDILSVTAGYGKGSVIKVKGKVVPVL